MWQASDMAKFGVEALGYNTMEEMWMNYTVFALVRNPYDRAGSSYDYVLSRREKVRCRLSLVLMWRTVAIGPPSIQTSASDFWCKVIHQTWARIPKNYLKRVNV
jgi:hypothetical protein